MALPVIPEKCSVAVIAGGKSGEREISLKSGEGASEALREAGFNVTVLDPARKEDLVTLVERPFDVAFLCLHGKGGEDGVMQGFLETIGLPYTGSGVWASALAMDKAKTKRVYGRHGVPTPPSVTVYRGKPYDLDAILAQVGPDCVVKVTNEGSTLGLFMTHTPDYTEAAIQEALALGASVLVEKFVAGDEYTVAVVGNENPRALPVIQIIPQNDFYDFESKYAPGGSTHLCPAPIDEALTRKLQSLAEAAHACLECRGMSRTDFIVEKDGTAWALETNTIPGMTGTSLLPDAARAAGITFPELCTKLVNYALDLPQERQTDR